MLYGRKWREYAEQWDKMRIKTDRVKEFNKIAAYALEHRGIYTAIEGQTGVPWPMIAILHRRESDADFKTYLGNGEPLNRKTRLVPKGRGPFSSFEEGAIDALNYDGLVKVQDWRLEKILYYCESFNGFGYANRNLPSPYVWGGTNIQEPGKYVGDGRWNGKVWDTQPGCAPILKTIMMMDTSIQYQRED